MMSGVMRAEHQVLGIFSNRDGLMRLVGTVLGEHRTDGPKRQTLLGLDVLVDPDSPRSTAVTSRSVTHVRGHALSSIHRLECNQRITLTASYTAAARSALRHIRWLVLDRA